MSRKRKSLSIDHSRRQFLGAAAAGAAVLQSSLFGAVRGDELPVSGIEQPALGSFDELMRDFVREQKVTGAALAVTRQGRRWSMPVDLDSPTANQANRSSRRRCFESPVCQSQSRRPRYGN